MGFKYDPVFVRCVVGFNFKRCFVSVFNMFAYSFISSIVLGAFAILVWFTCWFVGYVFSFLGNSAWKLTLVGLIGSGIGFFVGIFLTILKSIKNKSGVKDKE